MGQAHSAVTNFNSVPDFGARYVQQGTNGPTGNANHQWYGFTLGLGSEYVLSSYGSQFYWPRRAQNSDTYIYVRDMEGGGWNSWTKIKAGTADTVTTTAYNSPAIRSTSSGTDSSGASFAIQQMTGEGWTGIFVDYEPYTGWGLYHDNPNNYFCVTAESSTGNLRSFTVPSRESGNRTSYEKIRFDQNNGSITAGGNITALSDIRVKENIELISNAIDKITKIRGVTYTKNNDETGRKYAGVIAQEVEKVLPEVVFNTDESDPDSAKTVAYGNMIGLLIEAIKEQQKQIDELKAALSNK
jgi:hypothetical protein